jgi:hypothetical protein
MDIDLKQAKSLAALAQRNFRRNTHVLRHQVAILHATPCTQTKECDILVGVYAFTAQASKNRVLAAANGLILGFHNHADSRGLGMVEVHRISGLKRDYNDCTAHHQVSSRALVVCVVDT